MFNETELIYCRENGEGDIILEDVSDQIQILEALSLVACE